MPLLLSTDCGYNLPQALSPLNSSCHIAAHGLMGFIIGH
jgi:hypothetical protein